MIPINKKGVIISGNQFVGWNIFVEYDPSNVKGYLILYSKENEGYDEWVENYKILEEIFEEEKFVVKWEE